MIMVSSINLQLPAWEKKIGSTIEGKTLLVSTSLFSTSYSRNQNWTDYIEHIHSNYIWELFRDAQNIGGKVFYEELIDTMNQKSSFASKTRCILSLHKNTDLLMVYW